MQRRGILGDWGYAVPIVPSPSSSSMVFPAPISSANSHFPSDTTPSVPIKRNTIISDESPNQPEDPADNNRVYAKTNGSKDRPRLFPITHLSREHDVVLVNPAEDERTTDDANPLYRTGTWSWMSSELVMAGPNQPVVHNELHDLESFFYVLVGISILYDEPGKLKPDKELEHCFDKLFNTSEPSILKTIIIQSDLTWVPYIIKRISPYFQPVIPLLNKLRQEIILPLKSDAEGNFVRNATFSHDIVIHHIISTLSDLPEDSWTPRPSLDGHEDSLVPPVSDEEDNVSDVETDEDEFGGTSPIPPHVLQRDVNGRRAARMAIQSNPELRQKRPMPSEDEPLAKRLRSSDQRSTLARPTPIRGQSTSGALSKRRA